MHDAGPTTHRDLKARSEEELMSAALQKKYLELVY